MVKKGVSHPPWLHKSKIPVFLVCGPPASGKSTFVRNCAKPNDLILDLDLLAKEITQDHSRNNLDQTLYKRNKLLSKLSNKTVPWRICWLIVSEPREAWRNWWKEKLGNVIILLFPTPEDTCIQRILSDPTRQKTKDIQIEAVKKWWQEYALHQSK